MKKRSEPGGIDGRSVRRHPLKTGGLIVVLALTASAGLAAQAQQRPGDPRGRGPQPAQAPKLDPLPPAGEAPGGGMIAAPVDPKTYKIGAEDVLAIQVWKEPELSSIVNVRPDGFVTPNLIPEVQVVGLTPDQLKD